MMFQKIEIQMQEPCWFDLAVVHILQLKGYDHTTDIKIITTALVCTNLLMLK